jgi:DNA-binding transcriptional regulator YdaS (Cro superfamily)
MTHRRVAALLAVVSLLASPLVAGCKGRPAGRCVAVDSANHCTRREGQ